MKSIHWSIRGYIYKYLALFVYGSKRSKRLYQSQFLLNWVYLTCGRVCSLGLLPCADKGCLYLFVKISKIQYLAQSLANLFYLTCNKKIHDWPIIGIIFGIVWHFLYYINSVSVSFNWLNLQINVCYSHIIWFECADKGCLYLFVKSSKICYNNLVNSCLICFILWVLTK